MPKRKFETETRTSSTSDYWTDALSKLGLLSPIITEAETQISTTTGQTGWEMKVISDPLFEKFLRYGPGKAGGGPSTIAAFLNLPEEDKRFYARIFQTWKKIVKEKGVNVEALE